MLEAPTASAEPQVTATAPLGKDVPPSMPSPKRTRRKANGYDPKAVFPAPPDYETLRKESWIADFLKQAWPMIIVLGGLIFGAGRLSEQIADISKTVETQNHSIEAINSAFSEFRISWERHRALEAAALAVPAAPAPSPAQAEIPAKSPQKTRVKN